MDESMIMAGNLNIGKIYFDELKLNLQEFY
jgi:hypothetical protein